MSRNHKVGGGCHEGTNIIGEKAVNSHRTQLNDALIAFQQIAPQNSI